MKLVYRNYKGLYSKTSESMQQLYVKNRLKLHCFPLFCYLKYYALYSSMENKTLYVLPNISFCVSWKKEVRNDIGGET